MTKKQIEERFKNVFNGEGKLEGKLHLEIDRNVKSIQLPVRKVPVAVKEKLRFELSSSSTCQNPFLASSTENNLVFESSGKISSMVGVGTLS
jgi:hypothetical protein